MATLGDCSSFALREKRNILRLDSPLALCWTCLYLLEETGRKEPNMETDIHGYIEVKLNLDGMFEENWQTAVDLFWLYDGQDTDAFGCFFGVRNYARFRPLARGRSLPLDVSPEIKRLTGNGNITEEPGSAGVTSN